jgi:hypothetical protein
MYHNIDQNKKKKKTENTPLYILPGCGIITRTCHRFSRYGRGRLDVVASGVRGPSYSLQRPLYEYSSVELLE